MRVSILSSRDTDPNVVFILSFNVTFGLPSLVFCRDDESTTILHTTRRDNSILSREVIRSHYVDSSQPDITHVSVKVDQQRAKRTYVCEVTVEGRVHIEGIHNYNHDPKGTGATNVMVTGE